MDSENIITGIEDVSFNKQVRNSVEKTGEWPDTIHFTFDIPVFDAQEFLKKFESQRYRRKGPDDKLGSLVMKTDIIEEFFFLWSSGKLPGNLFEIANPGTVVPVKDKKDRVGAFDEEVTGQANEIAKKSRTHKIERRRPQSESEALTGQGT